MNETLSAALRYYTHATLVWGQWGDTGTDGKSGVLLINVWFYFKAFFKEDSEILRFGINIIILKHDFFYLTLEKQCF